jgi:IS30 family transposase
MNGTLRQFLPKGMGLACRNLREYSSAQAKQNQRANEEFEMPFYEYA